MARTTERDVEILTCRIVSNRLAQVMRKKGLTQEETARRARIVTQRQLWRYLKDPTKHCPSLERATALSIVLDTPLDQLFKLKIDARPVPNAR